MQDFGAGAQQAISFTVPHIHRNHKAYQGQGRGGGYLRVARPSAPTRKDRRDRHAATGQNNNVKEVETPPARSSLCTEVTALSTAMRNKVTKTVSRTTQQQNNYPSS